MHIVTFILSSTKSQLVLDVRLRRGTLPILLFCKLAGKSYKKAFSDIPRDDDRSLGRNGFILLFSKMSFGLKKTCSTFQFSFFSVANRGPHDCPPVSQNNSNFKQVGCEAFISKDAKRDEDVARMMAFFQQIFGASKNTQQCTQKFPT